MTRLLEIDDGANRFLTARARRRRRIRRFPSLYRSSISPRICVNENGFSSDSRDYGIVQLRRPVGGTAEIRRAIT